MHLLCLTRVHLRCEGLVGPVVGRTWSPEDVHILLPGVFTAPSPCNITDAQDPDSQVASYATRK